MLLSTEMILILGCVLVMLVYLTIAILRGAYVPANFEAFPWLLLLVEVIAFAFVGYDLSRGEVVLSTESIEGWSGLAIGFIMTWSSLLMLGKQLIQRNRKENDDG